MTVPFAFANLSGNIALAKLDSNFNTPITIGNTSVQLGNTVTTLNNMTLANVNITSGNVALTTAISANSGGTGLTSPGTAGNVLTSNGTAWVSSAVSGGGNGAPVAASYVLVSSNANLTSGRVLTAGGNVTITDNGPGNTIVINSSGGGGGGGGGLTLLATITTTVSATVNFLTTFSAIYDNYLITGNGVKFTSDEGLDVRLAVSGTADNGSNYITLYNDSVAATATSTSAQIPGAATVRSAGKGCNFEILVTNANDTGNLKSIVSNIVWNDVVATGSYVRTTRSSAYSASNAVTGISLFATFGGNFAAGGKVRVYGYQNS
jgi:hypothetical protein